MCPGEFCPDSNEDYTDSSICDDKYRTNKISFVLFYTHLFKPDSFQGYAKLLHLISLV